MANLFNQLKQQNILGNTPLLLFDCWIQMIDPFLSALLRASKILKVGIFEQIK
jgi:hypothetical protein